MSQERVAYRVLSTSSGRATMEGEQTRRMLACGLDELEAEIALTERTLIQWLNRVRAIQGKRPVILPRE